MVDLTVYFLLFLSSLHFLIAVFFCFQHPFYFGSICSSHAPLICNMYIFCFFCVCVGCVLWCVPSWLRPLRASGAVSVWWAMPPRIVVVLLDTSSTYLDSCVEPLLIILGCGALPTATAPFDLSLFQIVPVSCP